MAEQEHRPTTTDGMDLLCREGECDHDDVDECLVRVTVCGTCLDRLPGDYDGVLPKWPCESTEATE